MWNLMVLLYIGEFNITVYGQIFSSIWTKKVVSHCFRESCSKFELFGILNSSKTPKVCLKMRKFLEITEGELPSFLPPGCYHGYVHIPLILLKMHIYTCISIEGSQLAPCGFWEIMRYILQINDWLKKNIP